MSSSSAAASPAFQPVLPRRLPPPVHVSSSASAAGAALCKFFLRGHCQYGAQCRQAHGAAAVVSSQPPAIPLRSLTGSAATDAISNGAASFAAAARPQPALLVLDSVACLGPGFASNALLLLHLPPLLNAHSIGSLFAAHGRVRVNLALTRRQGLVGVLDFATLRDARNAFEALSGMQIEVHTIQSTRSRDRAKSCAALTYTLRPRFACTPLVLRRLPRIEAKPTAAAVAHALLDPDPTHDREQVRPAPDPSAAASSSAIAHLDAQIVSASADSSFK